jgi:hypothetical protein
VQTKKFKRIKEARVKIGAKALLPFLRIVKAKRFVGARLRRSFEGLGLRLIFARQARLLFYLTFGSALRADVCFRRATFSLTVARVRRATIFRPNSPRLHFFNRRLRLAR